MLLWYGKESLLYTNPGRILKELRDLNHSPNLTHNPEHAVYYCTIAKWGISLPSSLIVSVLYLLSLRLSTVVCTTISKNADKNLQTMLSVYNCKCKLTKMGVQHHMLFNRHTPVVLFILYKQHAAF